MSKKVTKRHSSIKDLDNSGSSIEYKNSTGPSTSKAKHVVSNEELLALLENSDFEEDVAESGLSSEDEEEEDNVCGMYIVEPDALVPPLEIPSQMSTNYSSVISSSATPATINSSSFTENRSQDQVEWTSTRTNNLSIPVEGNAELLCPQFLMNQLIFYFIYLRTIYLIS